MRGPAPTRSCATHCPRSRPFTAELSDVRQTSPQHQIPKHHHITARLLVFAIGVFFNLLYLLHTCTGRVGYTGGLLYAAFLTLITLRRRPHYCRTQVPPCELAVRVVSSERHGQSRHTSYSDFRLPDPLIRLPAHTCYNSIIILRAIFQ